MRTTAIILSLLMSWMTAPAASGEHWERHVIDDASRGADGVKLADINQDGLLDGVTGWEEGGEIRVCLNPGKTRAKEKWPAVRVGKVRSPEDAVFVDLDGDRAVDVVSCCEGQEKSMYVHWGPRDRRQMLDEQEWRLEALPRSVGVMRWMFCVPAQVDGKYGPDLICGGKDEEAAIGWFEAPREPRKLQEWTWHALRPAGWVMSLAWTDMDGDGDGDILLSDRMRARQGVFWLENPGPAGGQTRAWKEHAVGAIGREVMFLTQADLDDDGLGDVVVAAKPSDLIWLRRLDKSGTRWESHSIRMPAEAGRAKAVAAGDVNGDGRGDLVFSCEGAENRPGVMWLSYRNGPGDQVWDAHHISGPAGIKYDLVELIDLDGDGDLDVMTSEERELNAVIWYENPAKSESQTVKERQRIPARPF